MRKRTGEQGFYKKAIELMENLYVSHPHYTLGRHLSTALADYGDFWGITNKEFCFALEKYAAELELDGQEISSEAYVNNIVEDAKHLFENIEEEEEEE